MDTMPDSPLDERVGIVSKIIAIKTDNGLKKQIDFNSFYLILRVELMCCNGLSLLPVEPYLQ
jgi:hypothetical protein